MIKSIKIKLSKIGFKIYPGNLMYTTGKKKRFDVI